MLLLLAAAGLVLACITLVLYKLSLRPRPAFAQERSCTTNNHGRRVECALPTLSDAPTVHLSVVIPAYNESKRLPAMLQEAAEYLEAQDEDYELLIVDDGSSDNTAETALAWAADNKLKHGTLKVCRLLQNRGKGGAVAHGMKHIAGRYGIFADADGASKFSDVALLFSHLKEENGLGMASGSRAHMVSTDAVVKRSPLRNLLMHGFHTFIRLLGVPHIKDTQCGFKLFTRRTCALLFPNMHIERYAFDVELFVLAGYLRVPVEEVAITWHEVDGSKMHLVQDSLSMAMDLVLMRLGYTLGLWRHS
ncbi:family 2 glycosyltransferase [Protomyces lactucae-debilis]|uniref:dolichyl-phosphate beta-glucosyltransferase n=1 Tax=Protomyces lactucae-debilis TaxID=2754530 RepID=A0A1Y2FJL9_PROLT|nr:family 2 glycosyltransferase [Protomyces lactucae-debilis]ORY83787.1 family 2 glycosyltransferase [Protomyces lactucae-debilis]